ncbi:cation-translocating P-type ATPase [Alkaliphilus sp. B6464]|uniref:cation-translocating P-type ATPase n=1 Tax=Alkaliphilus sp. B6464 TaxID=2731219 RepID=UPI001BA63B60|nr:cation-translocating P-type ATPase [Alkaliphilus sp. B6464]QUH21965.1 cation-translocating P-type ATPase [Alkaliphilus sp. B6464]
MNNSFKKSYEEILSTLGVSKGTGLNNKQVEESRKKYGYNEFTPPKKESFFTRLLDNLKDPMILILLVATFISLSTNVYLHYSNQHSDFIESIAILLAVMLSTTIAMTMEGKSQKAFETLNQINDNIKVKVLRDRKIIYLLKRELVVGDIVFLETGDKAPADGRLIEAFNLKINESMLTGESDDVKKNAELVLDDDKTPLGERKNMVFGGTFVTEGKGTMIVTSVGDDTEMGRIAEGLKDSEEDETPLQEKLGDLGKKISLIGTFAAGIIFVIKIIKMMNGEGITAPEVINAFIVSITLIVAAVPEGLPTMISMTLSLNMQKMAKNNSLVKKLIACETVGSINVICSDKTGTLTENKMTVVDIYSNGKLIKPDQLQSGHMIENFAINSTANLQIKDEKHEFIGNATECSLLEAFTKTICSLSPTKCINYMKEGTLCESKCSKYLNDKEVISNYEDLRHNAEVAYQYAFSSDRKMMSTVIKNGETFTVYTKGASEKILDLCTKVAINGQIMNLTDEIKVELVSEIEKLQSQAKRVLGFAHREVAEMDWLNEQIKIEDEFIFDGFVGIADPLRKEVYDAVRESRAAGVDLKILTGDNKVTATAIANELEILDADALVLEAHEIEDMSDEELLNIIDRIKVIARSKPMTKQRIVDVLKKKGDVVAVTGDGINDAPALKKADCGIAMGIAGTEVSKEAADIVLLDDSFSSIVTSIFWGRGIYENFQRFIQFQLTVNVVAFLTAFLAEIFGFPMPFTALELLWVNIVMDGPPALTLGLEPPRKHLMKKEPIKRDASIVTKDMLSRIILHGLFMVGMLIFLLVARPFGDPSNETQQLTITFTTFVMFQIFNAFNSREFGTDSVFKNLFHNKIMLVTIFATFLIQVAVTQFGGSIFKTVPLDLVTWIRIVGFSSTIIIFGELVKVVRKIINK